MRRGAIVTVAAGGGYGGKPRPAVIVQSDDFASVASVTVCLISSTPIEAPLIRLRLDPDDANGLRQSCWIMVDKIVTLRRGRVGRHVGRLAAEDVVRLDRAPMVFLGLAGR